jgi:hypothetical protein
VAIVDWQTAKEALEGDSAVTSRGRIARAASGTSLYVRRAICWLGGHSAGNKDRKGARAVLNRTFSRLDTITKNFVEAGYNGKLIPWAKEMFGYDVVVG